MVTTPPPPPFRPHVDFHCPSMSAGVSVKALAPRDATSHSLFLNPTSGQNPHSSPHCLSKDKGDAERRTEGRSQEFESGCVTRWSCSGKAPFQGSCLQADGMLPGQVGGIALEGLLFFYFQSCNKSRRGDRKQETYRETEQRRLLSEQGA